MTEREQLALFNPVEPRSCTRTDVYDKCSPKAPSSTLYTRGCSPRVRGAIRRYCTDNDILSEAQGVRILIAASLRRKGYL